MNNARIQALPIHLANQIAAGEVVERPASVLKELVENSIDAGATQISIAIENAGRQLIKVTDNGSGIHSEDLALALSRHATSKLHSSEQLSKIDTLGFRGEALPSIASVSELTISSKQAEQEHGWQYSLSSTEATPTAHPNGTTVSVANLFFNLPARRRFLRSNKTELQHITQTFHRLALSRFDVSFQLTVDNKPVLKLPAVDSNHKQERIARISGRSFIQSALYLEQTFDEIGLHGWINQASSHRANTDVQYFFINGRVIRDRLINHAIRQAYGAYLPVGRQAAYVLYLTLPPEKVDINVHPTKHEVRFRDARLIHGLISQAIEQALATPTEETTQSNTEIPAIAEANADYKATPPLSRPRSNTTQSHNTATQASSRLQLLHNRYIVTNDAEPKIIDLAAAEQMNRQQTFLQAVKTHQLKARTILVPITIPSNEETKSLLHKHQQHINQLAISFELNQQGFILKTIPFLLNAVSLTTIAEALIKSLPAQNIAQTLIDNLSGLINIVTINSIQEAETILNQIDPELLKQHAFVKKLDLDTLARLFSRT